MVERPGNSGDARVTATPSDRPVSLVTLDEFLRDRQINQVDLIKIDVQGFEEKVLLGGRNTIERFKPQILIELDPPLLRAQGCSEDLVVEILLGYGYQLYVARRRALVPFQLPIESNLTNIFCLARAPRPVVS